MPKGFKEYCARCIHPKTAHRKRLNLDSGEFEYNECNCGKCERYIKWEHS